MRRMRLAFIKRQLYAVHSDGPRHRYEEEPVPGPLHSQEWPPNASTLSQAGSDCIQMDLALAAVRTTAAILTPPAPLGDNPRSGSPKYPSYGGYQKLSTRHLGLTKTRAKDVEAFKIRR